MNKEINNKLQRGLALTVKESWELYKYIKALEQTELNPSYNSVKTELEPCEDCISRAAVRELICQNNDYYGYSERFHEFTEKCLQLPPVTPKAELWSRLYIWLNDMYLGISPDEFTPDDERWSREAQTDIIEDIIEWINANVFEQKPKEAEE